MLIHEWLNLHIEIQPEFTRDHYTWEANAALVYRHYLRWALTRSSQEILHEAEFSDIVIELTDAVPFGKNDDAEYLGIRFNPIGRTIPYPK